jgi:hypothetical protein
MIYSYTTLEMDVTLRSKLVQRQHSRDMIICKVLVYRFQIYYINQYIKEEHPELSKISQGTISKILNASNIKPNKIRYYAAKVDPHFDEKATKVLGTYKEVKKLKKEFKKKVDRVILSCDEKTGIQAIGNKYPDMMPTE